MLNLNGIPYCGQNLRVGRPSKYAGPVVPHMVRGDGGRGWLGPRATGLLVGRHGPGFPGHLLLCDLLC